MKASLLWLLACVAVGTFARAEERAASDRGSAVEERVPHPPVFPIKDTRGKLKWGVINKAGRVLVPMSYDDISATYGAPPSMRCFGTQEIAQEGAILMSPDEWCYVSADGPRRMKPLCKDVNWITNLGDSLFVIASDTEQGHGPSNTLMRPAVVYDGFDKWRPPKGVYPHGRLNEGRVVIAKGELYGFADRSGKVVIEPEYDNAHQFSEGLAVVQKGKKWGFIDRDGNVAIELKYDKPGIFCEGLALVSVNDRELAFFIDKQGKRLHEWPPSKWRRYDSYGWFSEGFKLERIDPKEGELPSAMRFGFLDTQGKWLTKPHWHYAYSFSEGLAAVHGANGTPGGYIDHKGEFKIRLKQPVYRMRPFRHELAWVETHQSLTVDGKIVGGKGYINKRGEWVWKASNK